MGDKKVVFADLVADLKRKDGKPADVADLSSKNFVGECIYDIHVHVGMKDRLIYRDKNSYRLIRL